jgi:hypothetical protein
LPFALAEKSHRIQSETPLELIPAHRLLGIKIAEIVLRGAVGHGFGESLAPGAAFG